jgi:hypothetical protein
LRDPQKVSGRSFIVFALGHVAEPYEVDVDIGLRSGLVETAGPIPTFASAGLERRAAAIAGITGSSWDYIAGLLGHRPEVQVIVLSEADWPEKGRVPLFGLTNAEAGTLVVAGTEQ